MRETEQADSSSAQAAEAAPCSNAAGQLLSSIAETCGHEHTFCALVRLRRVIMDSSGVDVSLVIPAYNEEARIGSSLRSLSEYLEAQPYSSELVIVDDGSSDGTREEVRQVARTLRVPLILLSYAENRGKGYALKAGFAHAAGKQILFCDADLAASIEEISGLLEVLSDGADVAIGSRRIDGSNISIHQPWVRERLGKAYTWLVRWLDLPGDFRTD